MKGENKGKRQKMVTSVNMIFQFIVSTIRKSSTLCEYAVHFLKRCYGLKTGLTFAF